MKKICFYLLVAGIVLITVNAHAQNRPHKKQWKDVQAKINAQREMQVSENKAFRQTLKNVDPAQRQAMVIDHRNEQYNENKDFADSLYREKQAKLEGRLASADKLTGTQKQEILDFTENNYQDSVSFRTTQHNENLDFIESLDNSGDMTKEEMKSLLTSHQQKQKQENKSFHQQQKQKRKDFRQKLKSEIQSSYSE